MSTLDHLTRGRVGWNIVTGYLDSAAKAMGLTEGMIRNLFKEVLDLEFGEFPHMTFEEAMRRYGSDKPDLRNPLELVDVADQLKEVDFKVFSGPANDPCGSSGSRPAHHRPCAPGCH